MPQNRAAWLLDRLHVEGARVTPRERLAVAEAVAALNPGDDELAAMVASLVAHTEEEWRWVYGRGLALLPTWRPVEVTPKRGRPERLGWGLGLGFGAYVVLMVLGWGVTQEREDARGGAGVEPGAAATGDADDDAIETTAVEASPEETTAVEASPEEATTEQTSPEQTTPIEPAPPAVIPTPKTTAAAPTPLTLVSSARVSSAMVSVDMITPTHVIWGYLFLCLSWVFVFTFMLAPELREKHLEKQLRAARDKADALYREGRQGQLTLNIPKGECLGREAILSAATRLGRQALNHPSPHLDIPATVDHTAREAGRVIHHHLPALGGPPLLVWVDVERGDHPLLWTVEAVLSRWTREGLPFVRLNYAFTPELLTDPLSGRRWALGDVGRRYAGAPLLLFTRLTSPQGFYGEASWPRQLSAWPRRALIHLHPLHRAPGWLRHAGLPCLPFTDEGLKAAAHLLARGERLGPTPTPPKLPSVSALREPLRRWAVAAACVPNPTWPQLEALRVGIPELKRDLPDPRLVQHLVEHLRPPSGDEPCSDDGESLVLPRRDMARLLAAQRGANGRPSPLEEAALRLLIQQLRGAPPAEETLADWRRRLRVACYELTLGERALDQVLSEFAESPVRDELERRLAQEDRVRVDAGAGSTRRLVEGLNVEGPLGLWEAATTWARLDNQQRAFLLLMTAAMVYFSHRDRMPGDFSSWRRPVELPEEWQVVVPRLRDVGLAASSPDLQPQTSHRPALVNMPGGTPFFMGNPEEALAWAGDRQAYKNELPRRELVIPELQVCQTEVTQAHYEAVLGTRPSDCSWGCGDNLPVQGVSWYDAVAYLNELTALESAARVAEGQSTLSACYEVNGTEVRWVSECTGYRLPTEAEWEYAARAGTTTSWSFGDDPATIGEYAWYSGNSGGTAHAVGEKKANPWGLYDMHGNVREWVWDAYDSYRSGTVVNSSGTSRTLRGGSLYDLPRDVRSTGRDWSPPERQSGFGGFRCARGAGPQR